MPRKSAQRSVNNKLKDDGVFTVRSSSLTESATRETTINGALPVKED